MQPSPKSLERAWTLQSINTSHCPTLATCGVGHFPNIHKYPSLLIGSSRSSSESDQSGKSSKTIGTIDTLDINAERFSVSLGLYSVRAFAEPTTINFATFRNGFAFHEVRDPNSLQTKTSRNTNRQPLILETSSFHMRAGCGIFTPTTGIYH